MKRLRTAVIATIYNKAKSVQTITNKISNTGKDFLLASIITAVTIITFLFICPPHFTETNDDMIMASFLYGYMGQSTDKLVFINILVGKFLKLCVSICPALPWYTLLQYVIISSSLLILIFLMIQKFGRKLAFVPITFCLLFFGYEFLSSLQFTKTAAIAVIAGMLLMFYGVYANRRLCVYLIGGTLTFIGSLYRFRIFEMMLLLMFGVGLIVAHKSLFSKKWIELFKICIPFFVVISICFVAFIFDRWTYNHSEGWEDFWEYNYLRDNLQNSKEDVNHTTGFPDYDENQELYASLNITKNDYYLYCSGNFADTELFTPYVVNTLVSAKSKKIINFQFIESFIKVIGKGLFKYTVFPSLCISIWAAMLCINKKEKQRFFLLFYEILVFVGIQFYFYHRGRYLQSRTDVSLIFALVMILILYNIDLKSLIPTNLKTVALLAGTCIIFAIPSLTNHRSEFKTELAKNATTKIHSLISSDMSHFYLCYTNWGNFPDKMYDAWDVAEEGCGKNRSALGTWRVSTPTVINKLAEYDIANPYRDIVDNKNIYLLCVDHNHLDLVMTHIRDHYAQNACAHKVKLVEERYPLYVITTENLELDVDFASDGTNILNYDISINEEDNTLYINGYLYGNNENSFASNIYIGIIDENGSENFYYTTQHKSDFTDDNMNGEYGSFSCSIPLLDPNYTLNLYLETNEELYVVPFQ